MVCVSDARLDEAEMVLVWNSITQLSNGYVSKALREEG